MGFFLYFYFFVKTIYCSTGGWSSLCQCSFYPVKSELNVTQQPKEEDLISVMPQICNGRDLEC